MVKRWTVLALLRKTKQGVFKRTGPGGKVGGGRDMRVSLLSKYST